MDNYPVIYIFLEWLVNFLPAPVQLFRLTGEEAIVHYRNGCMLQGMSSLAGESKELRRFTLL